MAYNHDGFWESGLDNFEKIDKDLVKFYFDQAEKSLKSTLELADKISIRAYALLATCIPFLTIIISLLSKNYLGSELLSCQLLLILWVLLIPISFCFISLLKVAFPKDYHQLGREPKYIVEEKYYNNPEYPGESSYKLMLSYEIEEYQNRITYMDKMNNSRVEMIKIVFKVATFTLSFFILILIVKMFLSV